MNSAFLHYVFDILDNWANDTTPGGVAIKLDGITDAAYDYYVSHYGVPKTANQARHMFEWASALEPTISIVQSIR